MTLKPVSSFPASYRTEAPTTRYVRAAGNVKRGFDVLYNDPFS